MRANVVYSRQDPVGRTVKSLGYDFEELDGDVTSFSWRREDPLIVISRHESSAGIPALTVHYTLEVVDGNPMMGISLPTIGTSILRTLLRGNPPIRVSFEASHHGPILDRTPLVFVEVGSDKTYWTNEKLVSYLVKSVLDTLGEKHQETCKERAIGLGGGHYASRFTSMAQEVCFGHIVSKHNISRVRDFSGLVEKTILRESEKVDAIYTEDLSTTKREEVLRVASVYGIRVY